MFYSAHLASWLLAAQLQAATRPSDIYREEFRQRPETAAISRQFSADAWIVLLFATRQGPASSEGAQRADEAMERLRSEVKTDGEWLFWYRLSSYSTAKLAGAGIHAGAETQSMQDVEGCRSDLALANRARVMKAAMPTCELVPSVASGRKP